MKKLFSIFIIISYIMVIISCDENVQKKPKVSGGKTNEIVVVMSNPSLLESKINDTIKSFFMQPDTMLSQPEALFSLSTITQQQFDESNFFFHHHNILMVHKDTAIHTPLVETQENPWTKPQRVVWMKFAEDSEFFNLFSKYQNAILKMYDDNEITRVYQTLQLGSNQSARLSIDKIFHFKLDVPAGFSIARTDSNFIWLTQRIVRKNQDLTAGIMIWQRPYISEKQFTMNELVKNRNEITLNYIPGPSGTSFMKTSIEYIAPTTKVVTEFPTGYAVEMRGLWDMVGDFMGGPFISYTFVHPKTQQLITIEGFVYNPNNKKRVFLRQMQSVFWHLEISQNND